MTILTTPKGIAFILTSVPGQMGSVSWVARNPGGEVICRGCTDNPTTAEERAGFVEEVKDCVDITALGYESQETDRNPLA